MAAAFALMLAYLGEHLSARSSATPSRPTSPAMSPATCSAACSRPPSPIISAWRRASRCSRCSTCRARCWCIARCRGRCRSPRAVEKRSRAAWTDHLRNRPLLAGFGIGFCILFAFIGTFTYVNFVLAARAVPAGDDVARLRLPRVPAVDRDYAARRSCGRALRHADDLVERTRHRRRGIAAAADARPGRRRDRPCADRRRDVPGAGRRHRFHRRRGAVQSRAGQRAVSGELFPRRARGQRRPGAALCRVRLVRVRRRHRHRARHRRAADHEPDASEEFHAAQSMRSRHGTDRNSAMSPGARLREGPINIAFC